MCLPHLSGVFFIYDMIVYPSRISIMLLIPWLGIKHLLINILVFRVVFIAYIYLKSHSFIKLFNALWIILFLNILLHFNMFEMNHG